MQRLALLCALALTLAACDSTGPDDGPVTGVYVLNQGAFGNDASGGVTVYDPETGSAGAFAAPGGLVQSGVVREGRLYLLVNFSDSFSSGRGRLDVIDVETGQTVQQIDVGTPRGIAFTDDETAFVTDLYGAAVTPVDLATGTAGTPIPVGDNPEGIAASGGRLFVANSGFGTGSTLSVIRADSREVTETVDLDCENPNEVVADARGRIAVVCLGRSDFATGEVVAPARVLLLDAATLAVREDALFLGETFGSALGQDAAYDAEANALYVLAGSDEVLRLFLSSEREAETIAIAENNASGVGFADGRLYVARLDEANPFSDDGSVTVHDPEGALLDTFEAGVVPSAFAFARD